MDTDFIVDFYKYCEICKHRTKDEIEEPCRDCLNEPVNKNSEKPVYYEEQ